MQKKPIILWSAAAILTLICCVVAITSLMWQFLPLVNDSDLMSGIVDGPETATFTPIPVIERTPVAVVSTTASPTPGQKSTPSIPPASATPSPVAEEPSHSPEAEREAGQASPLQLSTEELLTQAVLPERDQRLLASRLKYKGQEIPETAVNAQANFQVGAQDTFWITDNGQTPPEQFQVEATLKYVTDHSYWWVEDGMQVEMGALKRSADRFETQTYPTNREFFGSEWVPGVDHDVRVHVFMGNVPSVAGYFSASNSYPKRAEPYSNEREMFFINLDAISPGNDYFDSVLAHEFQHMIHWHQDRNEDTWVNEGMSELASFINGYGISGFVGAFSYAPDTQLNSWASTPNGTLANYGGSFLFMAYFLQRYGEEMTQAVVANPQRGITGFNAVLAEHGYPERFDDVFADFLAANYLHNPEIGDGVWGYKNLTTNPVALSERYSIYPVEEQTTVYQYGSDYIELSGNSDVTLEFTGSTRVKVLDTQAHSGSYVWYSHRGDDSNPRLTRRFDLSQVTTATLSYWTWYDIEADWDYGYVEVSTDGGKSWAVLQPPGSVTTNPSGNAFGPGYTGLSGGGPVWIEERLDLSAYTGQEVLIRFEYVTDDAVNRPGWAVDDISIPEIGFFDDAEAGLNEWQAEGFVRMDNILPQRFLVQLIEVGDQAKVRPLPLDDTNYGTITISGLGSEVERAILVVAGLTPVTTEPASYQYKIRQ